VIAVCAALCALAGAAGAEAASPADYLAHLNKLCAGFTPEFATTVNALGKAEQARNEQAYYAAVGELMYLSLDEDTSIESVPVPPALGSLMAPALSDLKRGDGYLRVALGAATMGDGSGELGELARLAPLTAPVDSSLERAGLAACGTTHA